VPAQLCVVRRLPSPPLTAGSFPATILVEDGGLFRLYRFDLGTGAAAIGENGDRVAAKVPIAAIRGSSRESEGREFPPFGGRLATVGSRRKWLLKQLNCMSLGRPDKLHSGGRPITFQRHLRKLRPPQIQSSTRTLNGALRSVGEMLRFRSTCRIWIMTLVLADPCVGTQ
jgi:hypothetical protein